LHTKPWFAFCNVAETHFPYNIPGTEATDNNLAILLEAWGSYPNKDPDSCLISSEYLNILLEMQKQCIEEIDRLLSRLFSSITTRRPTLVIATADHGEEFGEFGRFGHGHSSKSVLEVPIWVGMLNSNNPPLNTSY
jgi:membrane-anchored protein YejM (alkaline phosphatase superfamily)